MATVPNTSTFTLQDVINVVGGTNLVSAFANATDARFDPSYKGSKDNLLNFRNYDTTRGAYTLSCNPTYLSGVGSGKNVVVTTQAGNSWTASSGSIGGWCLITGGGPKSGNGNFTVQILAYPQGGSMKSGNISVISGATTFSIGITRP
jgi:hypothetical protein